MLYITVDETKIGIHEDAQSGKRITKEGNIVAQEYTSVSDKQGFRPGMMPLRSMKMQWTLNEFISLDEQFEYKLKVQDKSICNQVSIDTSSLINFQEYMRTFDFQRIRIGYLYGTFSEDNKVRVECIYEPPQEATDTSFELLNDPNEENVQLLASLLGLRKVGVVLAHPPRESKFHFTCSEVLFIAEQQLEAAQGINETPFVTIKVTIDPTQNNISYLCDGWSVSQQCMEMVAEGVIGISKNLGCCTVNPTFTAYVEGKPVKEIDLNFFYNNVAIIQHDSNLLSSFPKMNRELQIPTMNDLKTQISKSGKEGWKLESLLADFSLLLFLGNYLSFNDDIPLICRSILDPEVPLDDGYALIIRSLAGMN